MYEMLVGIAIGYIAFTENGHKIGNSIADFATKNGKTLFDKMMESNSNKNSDKTTEK